MNSTDKQEPFYSTENRPESNAWERLASGVFSGDALSELDKIITLQ